MAFCTCLSENPISRRGAATGGGGGEGERSRCIRGADCGVAATLPPGLWGEDISEKLERPREDSGRVDGGDVNILRYNRFTM